MITTEIIRATGLYLLSVLKTETAVKYSRFYGPEPKIEDDLVAGLVPFLLDEELSSDDIREEAHVCLDFAACELEDLGVVRITFLESKLMDGESDFRIELTEKGEEMALMGLSFRDSQHVKKPFRFHGPNYGINAKEASEWIISLLDAGGPGQTMALKDVMSLGASEAGIVVMDDCGNGFNIGTGSYAWAFEVCLWHHARLGNVVSAAKNAEEAQIWNAFVKKTGRPDRPSINVPRPIWDVEFKLRDALDPEKVVHCNGATTY